MRGDKDGAQPLYPPIEPNRQGWLAVDGLHRLYWEESGNPAGMPVLFLHGGPGAGSSPVQRRFLDPRHYRILLFDQRGAGASIPKAEIADNTTAHLIADIEALRKHLNVERWLVFGGSWGSTLALAYGQAYPERCLAFILRGIFLFRAREVAWFLDGMGRFFPEAAARFKGHIPPEEQDRLLSAFYRRLTDPDPAIHLPAASVWCGYEEACSRLIPERGEPRVGASALAMARIEAHYMMHAGFLDEGQLLRDIHRLKGRPATIVQGRYDMVCPPESAHDLAAAWPDARLVLVPDAGHSALEPGIRTALVAAANRYRSLA